VRGNPSTRFKRVWGLHRTYVSVRRLFIFLERSIYEGTQWVVFEPNPKATAFAPLSSGHLFEPRKGDATFDVD